MACYIVQTLQLFLTMDFFEQTTCLICHYFDLAIVQAMIASIDQLQTLL